MREYGGGGGRRIVGHACLSDKYLFMLMCSGLMALMAGPARGNSQKEIGREKCGGEFR
jgi:hypothetical protein